MQVTQTAEQLKSKSCDAFRNTSDNVLKNYAALHSLIDKKLSRNEKSPSEESGRLDQSMWNPN